MAIFSRVVDDWTLLKCLKEDRQIYAIKVVDYQVQENTKDQDTTMDSTPGMTLMGGPGGDGDEAVVPEFSGNGNNLMDSATTNNEYQSCVICMEDLPTNELKQHNACDCVICLPCLERTIGNSRSKVNVF